MRFTMEYQKGSDVVERTIKAIDIEEAWLFAKRYAREQGLKFYKVRKED